MNSQRATKLTLSAAWYADYTVRVVRVEREYTMATSTEAGLR